MTVRFLCCFILVLAISTGPALAAQPARPARPPAPAAKAAPAVSPAVTFAIAPAPSWVRPFAPDPAPSEDAASGGISYVLLDQQENLDPSASYYHEARRITSEHGVQNGASISVSFDPSYQRLTFHTIRLVRNGVESNRLNRSQVKLLQREEEMESFLYDESYTANCQLEDVRVGDMIEYSYTIEGANPILKGKYFDSFPTEWSIPVRHAVTRIVHPAARKLNFLVRNRTIQPAITTEHHTTEWLWDEENIPARQMDGRTPRGYNPYGMVQVSEFADWQQVVDWAVPLYQCEDALSPEFEELIAKLRVIEEPEARILAALRFVQDEIRYLGIESGVGSHKPTAPSEVLRRRFGDCKDKTLFLGTLLRQLGITATPALVSANLRNYVADRLPSPGVFNHVILHVKAGAGEYWLDATRTHQRGPLPQIHTSNFGRALRLEPGVMGLTECVPSPGAMPNRKIVETYHIMAPGKDSRLEVVAEFRGGSADGIRGYFQNNPKENIQKDYLQYYARRYPNIRTAQALDFQELPGEAGCVVKESYTISDLWELSDDKAKYQLTLYPNDLDEDMGTPGSAQRKDPLALNHPVNVTQEIRAEMFQKWALAASKKEVTNAFFEFSQEAKGADNHLVMRCSYKTLTDQVTPADLPAYDAALRKLKDKLGYTFTYRTPEQIAANQTSNPLSADGQLNWPIALLLGVIVAGAIPLSIRYYFTSKLPSSLPPSLDYRSLEGLGGWLIVVAIGMVVRPLMFVHANVTIMPTVFGMETWQNLTHIGQPAYHPYWMPVLLFGLIYNSLAAIFSILLAVLFFRKRAAWPRCFIIFLIFVICGIIVDLSLGAQIPAAATEMQAEARGLVQTIFYAAIWIPYALVSKRVKATFRY